MKKIILLFIGFIVLVVALGQIDDELSEESKALSQMLEEKRDSPANAYLHGIFASESESPEKIGRALINEYQKRDLAPDYQLKNYPQDMRLATPTGELFCGLLADDCFKKLFKNPIEIEAIREQYAVLIERVDRFHEFNEYQTQTTPDINEPLPDLSYLSGPHRIKLLSAIKNFNDNKQALAVSQLLAHLDDLRNMVRLQDILITKLLYLQYYSQALDVLSVVLSSSDSLVLENAIANLSIEEKSFEQAFAREFDSAHRLLGSFDQIRKHIRYGKFIPEWLYRVVLKPNMTTNMFAPFYHRLIYLATLSPGEFSNEIEDDQGRTESTLEVRNIYGSQLDYFRGNNRQYVARVMDLDTKIKLFNHIHVYKDNYTAVKNPYYQDRTSYYTQGSVCFDGPLEDRNKLRCLRLEI